MAGEASVFSVMVSVVSFGTWATILPEPASYPLRTLPTAGNDGSVNWTRMATHTLIAPLLAILISPLAPTSVAAQDLDPAPLPTEEIQVNIARVKERLEAQPDDGAGVLLRLEYQLLVYGDLLEINPFEGFDVRHGPVPYGVPTHQELLNSMTPGELRSETIPLIPLLRWTFGR